MDLKKNLYTDLSELSKVWIGLSDDMQLVIANGIVGEKCDYLLCRAIESLKNFNEDYREVEAAIDSSNTNK